MLEDINRYVLGAAVPILIIGCGVFFLVYLRFFFVVKFKRVFGVLFRRSNNGGVSPFGAMTVALAGTLGVGNIVGVASAVILGGYGAVFWMWVSALAAMVLKYAEIVLAMRHRKVGDDGRRRGGAMYYIEDCLGKKTRLGKRVGQAFALFCVINSLGMGCMLQANAVGSAFEGVLRVPPYLVGAVMAVLVGVVLIYNIHNLSGLTTVIIPTMTVLYILMSTVVLFIYRDGIGKAFITIFCCAFGKDGTKISDSAVSGIFGYLMSGAVRYGTMRGLLSNEAGCGTAPMAHAETDSDKAGEQGVWGIFEVFVDTILLCTLTALVIILVFGSEDISAYLGSETALVFDAFGRGSGALLGGTSRACLAVSIFFFAYATIICWAYYGISSLSYCVQGRTAENIYKAVYLVCVFIGTLRVNGFIWQISDFSLGCMTVINLTVLFIMRKEINDETKSFMHRL